MATRSPTKFPTTMSTMRILRTTWTRLMGMTTTKRCLLPTCRRIMMPSRLGGAYSRNLRRNYVVNVSALVLHFSSLRMLMSTMLMLACSTLMLSMLRRLCRIAALDEC